MGPQPIRLVSLQEENMQTQGHADEEEHVESNQETISQGRGREQTPRPSLRRKQARGRPTSAFQPRTQTTDPRGSPRLLCFVGALAKQRPLLATRNEAGRPFRGPCVPPIPAQPPPHRPITPCFSVYTAYHPPTYYTIYVIVTAVVSAPPATA